MKPFKISKPGKQQEFDFEVAKKKLQLKIPFIGWLFTGRRKKKDEESVDSRFYEH